MVAVIAASPSGLHAGAGVGRLGCRVRAWGDVMRGSLSWRCSSRRPGGLDSALSASRRMPGENHSEDQHPGRNGPSVATSWPSGYWGWHWTGRTDESVFVGEFQKSFRMRPRLWISRRVIWSLIVAVALVASLTESAMSQVRVRGYYGRPAEASILLCQERNDDDDLRKV